MIDESNLEAENKRAEAGIADLVAKINASLSRDNAQADDLELARQRNLQRLRQEGSGL